MSLSDASCKSIAPTTTVLGERDYPGGRVLVVVHSDERFEIFAPRALELHVIEAPTVSSVAGEILVEQLVDARIPTVFRELHWPNCLRASHVMRQVTAADLFRRKADDELLRTLGGLTIASKEGGRCS